MSILINCLSSCTCSAYTLLLTILDIVGPIILEVAGIGLFIDYLLKRREEKKWGPAKARLYARLIKLKDEILLKIIPSEVRQIKIRKYHINDIELETLFDWKELGEANLANVILEYYKIFQPTILKGLQEYLNDLNILLDTSNNLLDHRVFTLLLDLEKNIKENQ